MFFGQGQPLKPGPKPALTVNFIQGPEQLLAVGISEDETVFRLAFTDLNTALQHFKRTYQAKYKVILNIPPNIRR